MGLFSGRVEARAESVDDSQSESVRSQSILGESKSEAGWKDPGPPPDGGVLAWTQVLVGHLIIMNTWGNINSFGIYETYYVEFLNRSHADIAWIGSVQVFLVFFIGTFSGRLTDAGYFRPVFVFGTVLTLLGLFMASLSTQYWQLFLSQGICVGLGAGCLFCPALAIVSTYFSKRKMLAIGICACGSATGGLVYPAMFQQLIPTLGYGWTMRALAFATMVCLVVSNLLARPRLPPYSTGPIVELAAFKELSYTLFAIGIFLVFWGVYFAFYYLSSFGVDIIGIPQNESFNLFLVLNGVGIIGRTLPAYLADRYTGPMNILLMVTVASIICAWAMIGVTSREGLYAWTVVYGIVGNGLQAMFPATLSSLTTDLKKAGVRMGMIFTIVSFSVLTGPPIAGLLITRDNGRYMYAQVFAAASMVVGFLFLCGSRLAVTGKVLLYKI
ncbi:Major facilitator superfamily transporter [Colletotrichum higginsianum IMI 349063]|uniref:Major facilitator superfamily transporter n=4 Tax=Colletotrichum higginsianum TaxID=80884 RepID=A0A1B7XUC5_COLHI|nr:Major facilitator superfamily transporter [Colletotrichum higginsianum IMI 349063]OBR03367.1 Major facilitator superfamily transporter [Colletotrichum higginsianum IMI 349063]TIC89813.1 putative transporter MCH4 [Colletotrichum higginsianum]